ncbi:MAG: CxxxxCH/CxxCH domain-containing protein, partial [Geobacter sp.]|nr:CxxxxCH/CxxCH domain-containing protein [Geobacter sp.]
MTSYDYACQKCHNTTVDGTALDATTLPGLLPAGPHVNGSKDVALKTTDPKVGSSASHAGGTCTNVVCHSIGKSNVTVVGTGPGQTPYPPFATVSVSDAGSVGCDGCHGRTHQGYPDYTSDGAGTAAANSHVQHQTYGVDCSECHVATAGSSTVVVGFATHMDMDGAVDVGMKQGGTYTSATKTCASIYCHADRVWGGAGGCTSCHGNPPVSLGTLVYQDGNDGPADSLKQTGRTSPGGHDRHVNGKGLSCPTCHTGGMTIPTSADVTIEIGFNVFSVQGGSYTRSGTLSNGYTIASGNGGVTTVGAGTDQACSNIYCHSNASPFGGTNQYSSVTWTAGTLNCGSCHSRPSDGTRTWSSGHDAHTVSSNFTCHACHSATAADNATISNESNHVNNAKDVAIDNTYDNNGLPLDNYASRACSNVNCHMNVTTPAWGSALPDTAQCDSCHGGNSSSTSVAGLGPIATGEHTKHIAGNACGRCHSGTVTTGNDRSITGSALHVNQAVNVVFDSLNSVGVASNCSSLYCHSDGKGSFVTVGMSAWSGSTNLDCKGCHGRGSSVYGEPDYANAGAGQPGANSHIKHVSSSASCNDCHSGNVHVNGTFEVSVGGYVNGTTETCSNTYCHGGSGSVSPLWGGVLPDAPECDSCHGGNAASTTTLGRGPLATGKHTKHIAGASCGRCHSGTVTNGNDRLVTGTLHVNNAANVSFDGLNPIGVSSNCSNLYCHSDGKGSYVTVGMAAWADATTLSCKGCHGRGTSLYGEPDYANAGAGLPGANSHNAKHVTSSGSCNSCHSGNVHTNGAFDVTNAGWNGGTKRCENSYCHSNGISATGPFVSVSWPTWGGTVSCGSCHGALQVSPPPSAPHSKHVT